MPASAESNELFIDFSPYIKVYKDGLVERSALELVPASTDPGTGVRCKDIVILKEFNLSARLYLPVSAVPGRKLPFLVHYHGGAFLLESPFSVVYHKYLVSLVSEANVVALAVQYRLAPENHVPVAYSDSWLALEWVASQSDTEDWIRDFADLDRVYFGGDSAGANIAHNMAMRVGSNKLERINLRGIFLNCPYFWGKDLIGKEEEIYKVLPHTYPDKVWIYVCPSSSGLDDPRINPGMDPELFTLGCKKVLVYVGGKDLFRDRGWFYKEALEKSGWGGTVEIVDVEEEGHCFSVINPTCENSIAMQKKVVEFLNQ